MVVLGVSEGTLPHSFIGHPPEKFSAGKILFGRFWVAKKARFFRAKRAARKMRGRAARKNKSVPSS